MNFGSVPADRIRARNNQPPREGGKFVLYWMVANRRTASGTYGAVLRTSARRARPIESAIESEITSVMPIARWLDHHRLRRPDR